MYLPQSLNSWLVMIIGLVFLISGLYHGLFYRDRVLSAGMVTFGVGFLFLGLTDGFSDPTPRGKLFYRIAIIAFIIGIPILALEAWEMVQYDW
jgi:hypothetical protein